MTADPSALVDAHDCLLLDLDGTVFRGSSPTPGSVETLAAVSARTFFVTNNASRSAAAVADHLLALGFPADVGDVVTSAQSAAQAISRRLPAGSRVLVRDRLDTDIAAANAAGLPGMLVLSGVSTPTDLILARHGNRPAYLAEDLRGLRHPATCVRIGPQPGWRATIAGGVVTVTSEGGSDDLSALRAVADAAWRGGASTVVAGDRHSREMLQRWGLG